MNNIDILEEFIEAYRIAEEVLDGEIIEAIKTLIAEYKELKEKNKKAKEFIEENSHEIYCKRDELIELEFDDNTNATDLIDILEGNY